MQNITWLRTVSICDEVQDDDGDDVLAQDGFAPNESCVLPASPVVSEIFVMREPVYVVGLTDQIWEMLLRVARLLWVERRGRRDVRTKRVLWEGGRLFLHPQGRWICGITWISTGLLGPVEWTGARLRGLSGLRGGRQIG